MDLIYTNSNKEDVGVLHDYEFDLAFGADENNFECQVQASSHCCEPGSFLYIEGTEYGGIVDSIHVDTEAQTVTYKGRTWHGILAGRIIEPPIETVEVEEAVSALPEGYTKLEYIESTGTQYIDTGFMPNQNTRVICDFQCTNPSLATWQTIFAQRNTGATNQFTLMLRANNSWHMCFGDEATYPAFGSIVQTDRVVVDANKTVWTINGGSAASFAATTLQASFNLYLFGCNEGGSFVYPSAAKLYSCQIYDNDVLVRDFIPCKNLDGEIGLYDAVNGVFYGNAGTGTFHCVEARNLPDGFTQVEYIESSGSQYIDTGFVPNQDSRVVMDFNLLAVNGQYAEPVFGVRTSSSSKGFYLWASGYATTTEQYQSGYNAASHYVAVTRIGRHKVDKNKNITTIDGVSANGTYASFTAAWNLLLFNSYNNGALYGSTTCMKVYSCQVYDNGILIRDYVPCINASGVAGLYDLVNNKFYANAGSGAFAVGAEIVADTEPEETVSKTVTYKYDAYVVSGDANRILEDLINYLGLADIFTANKDASVVNVGKYSFRYVDAYKGVRNMLADYGGKLKFEFKTDTVILSAVYFRDFSQDEEFDSSQVDFKAQKNYRQTNHLICLGSGNMKDRHVVHLFADEFGGIQDYTKTDYPVSDDDYILDTSKQVMFGVDEVAEVYDYPNAQLVENYVAMAEQPLDWSDNYEAYFKLNNEGQYEGVVGTPIKEYVALTEQPSDWASRYANYFTKSGADYKAAEGVPGLAYKLQTAKPSDWESNYHNYYQKSGSDYVRVCGESYVDYRILTGKPFEFDKNIDEYCKLSNSGGFVPAEEGDEWEENRYVRKIEKAKAPTWMANTYYTSQITTVAPTWVAGSYYSLEDAIAKPSFAADVFFEKKYDHYAELVKGGVERLKSAWGCDSVDIDLDLDGEYDIGDIVGASEPIIGISVWQPITKKIVNIRNGLTTISYKVGD